VRVDSNELRAMMENPDELSRFAEKVGLVVHAGEQPTATLTRLMRLAVRAIDRPDLSL